MSVPRFPTIEHFSVWTDQARASCYPCIDGAHVDTEYALYRISDESLVALATLGAPERAFTIDSIALVEGEAYRLRVRFENEAGFGSWSPNAYARVGRDPFAMLAQTVPDAIDVALSELPIPGDFDVDIESRRSALIHDTATGDVRRRPADVAGRRSATLRWSGLSGAEYSQVIGHLRDNRGELEGLWSDDSALSGAVWWPRAGRLATAQIGPDAYSIEAELVEVLGVTPP